MNIKISDTAATFLMAYCIIQSLSLYLKKNAISQLQTEQVQKYNFREK